MVSSTNPPGEVPQFQEPNRDVNIEVDVSVVCSQLGNSIAAVHSPVSVSMLLPVVVMPPAASSVLIQTG